MRVLLVAYNNSDYIHYFPIGLSYIAAVLVKEGCDVEIYSQDKFYYPDDHLREYLDKNRFDIIGLGVVAGYYQYRKLLSISKAINSSKKRPFYMIGGHGPSPEPEFFLKKTQADAIVIGEGEETVVELVRALTERKSLSDIKGIAYRDGEKIIVNERRSLIKNIDEIPFPAYDLFPMDYYRLKRVPFHMTNSDYLIDMISARGCLFKCNFCYRMDEGFRSRSSEGIIEEIQLVKRNYGITYINFQDELLMSSKERAISLSEAFIKSKLNIKWICNGRLNFAIPEVLNAMKKAGCMAINYGIESMDDNVLRNMNKALTTKLINEGVKNTLNAGMSPGLNIIFGNIGDNKETLKKDLKFLLKYNDGNQLRTIRPVTPYPGCPLYYYAIEKGLIKDCEDFYENKHINSDLLSVNFTDMSDEEVHRCLFETNVKLIKDYCQKKADTLIEASRKLYLEGDASFRGFR